MPSTQTELTVTVKLFATLREYTPEGASARGFPVVLPEGTEMVMPGDNVAMTISLITPIAMDKELRFAIREGGRTVGAGVVSEIIE